MSESNDLVYSKLGLDNRTHNVCISDYARTIVFVLVCVSSRVSVYVRVGVKLLMLPLVFVLVFALVGAH